MVGWNKEYVGAGLMAPLMQTHRDGLGGREHHFLDPCPRFLGYRADGVVHRGIIGVVLVACNDRGADATLVLQSSVGLDLFDGACFPPRIRIEIKSHF